MNEYDYYINLINNYWFSNNYYRINYKKWFKNGKLYDEEIKKKFTKILLIAEEKKLLHWYDTKEGFVAHTILLDQFSRHIYRDTEKAYKNDDFALKYVNLYFFEYESKLKPAEKLFMIIPYQHSENILDQKKGMFILNCLIKNEKTKSGKNILEDAMFHQLGHLKIIEKFGRFPKRNVSLKRKSTKKEIEYIELTSDLQY